MSEGRSDVTRLLVRLSDGDEAVLDELLPAVYDELRRVAHNQLRGEADDHTLRTTELVHEAYFKLVDHASVDWQDRQHFFAVAARAMRQVLVDHARRKAAAKRGGDAPEVPLHRVTLPQETKTEELVALDDALDRLAARDKRAAEVVECRFFGGYTIAETADVLDVSRSTVKRDWRAARAWLNRALDGARDDASPEDGADDAA
jgi:RNA polymerase sigma factor (TIGR02999 family)